MRCSCSFALAAFLSSLKGMMKMCIRDRMNALQPALATLSANKVQYYEIPAHTLEISEALNEQLSNVWRKKRGIEVFSFNINSLSIPEEQQKKIDVYKRQSPCWCC